MTARDHTRNYTTLTDATLESVMASALEISNLRNIARLRFEIPDPGVWLLTAGNGTGKTTLLACLRRIGQPNAFPIHFPSSLRSERLDNHAEGSVTYEIGGETVEYAYRGERWTPRPRSNSHLFGELGYPAVIYVGATADRITCRFRFETETRALSVFNDLRETEV